MLTFNEMETKLRITYLILSSIIRKVFVSYRNVLVIFPAIQPLNPKPHSLGNII